MKMQSVNTKNESLLSIVASNENWFEIISDICPRFEQKNKPLFTTDNLVEHPSSSNSFVLLDGKWGLFCYNPLLGTQSISYASYNKIDGVFTVSITSYRLFMKNGQEIWDFAGNVNVLFGHREKFSKHFKIASIYARSFIQKLSKARNIDEYYSMLQGIYDESRNREWIVK